MGEDDLVSVDVPPPGVIEDWSAWLAQPDEESVTAYLRQQTTTGCPCGSETFLDQLESLLNRTVRRKKPGRKPKKQPVNEQNQPENIENDIKAYSVPVFPLHFPASRIHDHSRHYVNVIRGVNMMSPELQDAVHAE